MGGGCGAIGRALASDIAVRILSWVKFINYKLFKKFDKNKVKEAGMAHFYF